MNVLNLFSRSKASKKGQPITNEKSNKKEVGESINKDKNVWNMIDEDGVGRQLTLSPYSTGERKDEAAVNAGNRRSSLLSNSNNESEEFITVESNKAWSDEVDGEIFIDKVSFPPPAYFNQQQQQQQKQQLLVHSDLSEHIKENWIGSPGRKSSSSLTDKTFDIEVSDMYDIINSPMSPLNVVERKNVVAKRLSSLKEEIETNEMIPTVQDEENKQEEKDIIQTISEHVSDTNQNILVDQSENQPSSGPFMILKEYVDYAFAKVKNVVHQILIENGYDDGSTLSNIILTHIAVFVLGAIISRKISTLS